MVEGFTVVNPTVVEKNFMKLYMRNKFYKVLQLVLSFSGFVCKKY